MELLRRLGCADAVRDAGLPADHNTDVVYLTPLNGHELTRYERSTPAEVRAGRQHGVAANWPTPEPQHFLSQLFLEPVLRPHAVDHLGVDFREGTSSSRSTRTTTASPRRSRELASGERVRVRSPVPRRGRRVEQHRPQGASAPSSTGCPSSARCARRSSARRASPNSTGRSPAGCCASSAERCSSPSTATTAGCIHNGVPDGEDPATYDPEPAMFLAIGEPFDFEILGRARWTPRAMVATKFRDRRVFIAGDAAHLWVPMGGFGMNAGDHRRGLA